MGCRRLLGIKNQLSNDQIAICPEMLPKYSCVRWAFDLSQWRPTLAELSLATACLQAEEKARLMKFYFRDDFDASLIGRLLMRKFVRDTTGIAYDQIRFERDGRGKPFLVNSVLGPCRIDFNVSHQGNYSVLAGIVERSIADEPPVKIGIDVMKIEYSGGKPLTEFFRLMTRNFSDAEWKFIRSRQSEAEQLKAFMRFWCLKESYVKNVGVGITMNLQKISFKVKTDDVAKGKVVQDTVLEVDGNLLTNWCFEEHLLDEQHSVAIAFENLGKMADEGTFKVLGYEELMEGALPLMEKDNSYCQRVLEKQYKRFQ